MRVATWWLLALAACTAGCHTAPDVRPFTDATAQLTGSIKSAQRIVSDEIATLTASWEKDQRDKAQAISRQFNEHWAVRGALADALNDYSASLNDIVAAGDEGEKSAKAVADSFEKLTSALDIVPLTAAPGAGVNAGVKFGTWLYGRYAKDKAARSLGEAMAKTQPYIDEAAAFLAADLSAVETGLRNNVLRATANSVDLIAVGSIGREDANGDMQSMTVMAVRGLLKAHHERVSELAKSLRAVGTLQDAALRPLNERKPNDPPLSDAEAEGIQKSFARWAAVAAAIKVEIESQEALVAQYRSILSPYDKMLEERRERLAKEIRLMGAAREGLSAWADTHKKLAAAALQKRPPSVAELVDATQRVKELIKAVQDSKGAD